MTAVRPGSAREPGTPAVVRLHRTVLALGAGCLVGAVVTAGALTQAVPPARALHWGVIAAGCVVIGVGVARLRVPRRRWPDPPQVPLARGWDGLVAVEETLRRDARSRWTKRRPGESG